MKIVFVSNFFNHHQADLSFEFDRQTQHQYYFICTQPVSKERLDMGWGMVSSPEYVIKSYESDSRLSYCNELIMDADVVIWGAAPYDMVKKRIERGKLTFWYAERLFKLPCSRLRLMQKQVSMYWKFGRHKNLYLLCASAFTSADFSSVHSLSGRKYKWGYFPFTRHYTDIKALVANKKPGSILWVSRMIDWKHPEIPINAALLLKKAGYKFTLTMIGNGNLKEKTEQLILENNLSKEIHLIDHLTPEEVRTEMEQSEIFLLTSDRQEGWGAVINEAMNSGCAVTASHAAGSVPFLIKNRINGIVYSHDNLDELFHGLAWLLEHKRERCEMGCRAYKTIVTEWNAETAVSRLLSLCGALPSSQIQHSLFSEGPCSKAEIIEDNWYVNQDSVSDTLS